MDFAPQFLLYNRSLNPWGRDRELPQMAKQTFASGICESERTCKRSSLVVK